LDGIRFKLGADIFVYLLYNLELHDVIDLVGNSNLAGLVSRGVQSLFERAEINFHFPFLGSFGLTLLLPGGKLKPGSHSKGQIWPSPGPWEMGAPNFLDSFWALVEI